MIKRTMAFVALVALTVTGFTVAASAQTDPEPDRIQTISGKGVLVAKGEGTVDLRMGGRLHMRLVGDVTIEDLAGDMEFRIRTAPEDNTAEQASPEAGTTVTLENFDGAFTVRGSHFKVHAEGKVEFVARGHGIAYLDGTGRFRTRHHDWRPWVTGGIDIQPADTA